MNTYILLDEKDFVWCEEQRFGYWGDKKFALNKKDWDKRVVKMSLLSALFLRYRMRKCGIDAILREVRHGS